MLFPLVLLYEQWYNNIASFMFLQEEENVDVSGFDVLPQRREDLLQRGVLLNFPGLCFMV
jgi:hypothetical protein